MMPSPPRTGFRGGDGGRPAVGRAWPALFDEVAEDTEDTEDTAGTAGTATDTDKDA